MKPKEIKKLKRGMLIQYPNGSIKRVLHTFRRPSYRRKGTKMYWDSDYLWLPLTIRTLRFSDL